MIDPHLWIYLFLINYEFLLIAYSLHVLMADCCICKVNTATLKITDGNPKYKGKPICKECQGYRKLLRETK